MQEHIKVGDVPQANTLEQSSVPGTARSISYVYGYPLLCTVVSPIASHAIWQYKFDCCTAL